MIRKIVIIGLALCVISNVGNAQDLEQEALNKGLEYYNDGKYDEAIAEFNKAIQINPRCAVAYLERGLINSENRKYAESLNDFNKVIELEPNNSTAYGSRALVYHATGKYDSEISDLTKCIEFNPNFPEAYSSRGFALHKIGKHDEAIEDYTKALELNPANDLAGLLYYNRALAYYSKKEYGKAYDDVHKSESLGYNVDEDFIKNIEKLIS